MKILFVHSIGKRKFGGGEKWVLSAAKGILDKGHIVYLACRAGSVLHSRAKEKGIPVLSLNIFSDVSVYNIVKLTRFLRKSKIDIVVSKNRDFGVSGSAARLAGTPVVIARHGLPLRRWISKHRFLLNKFADGILVNARATKDMYVEKRWFSEGFITVIYNGVEMDTDCEPIPFATMYPGKKIILSVGRLTKQKGFSYLIHAAAILKRKRDDFMIIVLGEGKMRDRLLQQVKKLEVQNNIQFTGFVKNIGPYLKGSEFFVLPSLFEGLSNAALEAMIFGKPAILSDVNGSREIITHNETGFIVPPRDEAALAQAMDDLLSSKEFSRICGQKAREHVCTHFNIDGMVDKLEMYFENKLSAKQRLKVSTNV